MYNKLPRNPQAPNMHVYSYIPKAHTHTGPEATTGTSQTIQARVARRLEGRIPFTWPISLLTPSALYLQLVSSDLSRLPLEDIDLLVLDQVQWGQWPL